MTATCSAATLPSAFGRRVDAAVRHFLPQAEGVDFTQPPGEPALVGADSISWRIFKNPVALFIGGVTAVILELGEARVRSGVWEHTSFRTDPVRRLQRTGMAAMITVYGARSVAEAMIAGVRRMHGKVRGETPDGAAYAANDQELLDWVQATAGFGFAKAYDAYVRPLSQAELSRLYAEAAPAARLYGAVGAPTSEAEMRALFDAMTPRLEASPVVFEFLDILGAAPILPAPLAPIQRLLIRAAVDIVPAEVRETLGIGPRLGLRPWERPLVRAAGALADRIRLNASPAVQACRRLGLPDDYLYRARPA